MLQANPDVDVMIGSSQAIAGAEPAVKDAGAKVKLIGNGGSRQAIDAVREGRWFATYAIPEKTAGAKAAEIAISGGPRREGLRRRLTRRTLMASQCSPRTTSAIVQGEYDE